MRHTRRFTSPVAAQSRIVENGPGKGDGTWEVSPIFRDKAVRWAINARRGVIK